MSESGYFISLREALPLWPNDRFPADERDGMLDRIGITEFQVEESIAQTTLKLALASRGEAALDISGLEGFAILLSRSDSTDVVSVEVDLYDPFEVRLVEAVVSVRIPADILRRMRKVQDGTFEDDRDEDGKLRPYEISLRSTVRIDADGDVAFGDDTGNGMSLDLEPAMIGSSGVILEATDARVFLSRKMSPPNDELDKGWRGIYIEHAAVHFSSGLRIPTDSLGFSQCYIGSGGFTGQLEYSSADGSDRPPILAGLAGMKIVVTQLVIAFRQNALTKAAITGQMSMPFFEQNIEVEVGLDQSGNFSLKIADESGIASLEKLELLRLGVDSLAVESKDSNVTVKVSGELQLLVAGFEWPGIHINQLSIDSHGHVALDGGWLNLPEQFKVNFKGFKAELTKLGFGTTEDGKRRWIGFSGGIQLVDGIGLGGEFDGMRISWPAQGDFDAEDIHVTLEGVGVHLTIPNVLSFTGKVNFVNARDETATDEEKKDVSGFKGAVKLTLYPAKLAIDAEIMIIKQDGYTSFYLYLNGEFPAGIPLGATNVAIYGVAGLVGQNLAPKRGELTWYKWYKDPTLGVTPYDKWEGQSGAFALGAGVTLGTVGDNGHKVNGRLLLVILSGPRIILEGKANLLKDRSQLNDPNVEPNLAALAVLDEPAGQFLLNIDALYQKPGSGESAGKLLTIHAGAEAFFDFHRADAWHVYIGQDDPREKRIRAEVISLYKGEAYFMLTARALRMGFWVGYDHAWKFKVLKASLSAWIALDGTVSWKPSHVEGQLLLHGAAKLSAFGRGISLQIDAGLSGKSPTIWEVDGKLSFKLDLPWPLPDPKGSVHLHWEEKPAPPTPLVLGSVACEHLKVSEKWRCDRLPWYDAESPELGFWDGKEHPFPADVESAHLARCYDEDGPTENGNKQGLVGIPLVPMDARPVLSFAKPVTVAGKLFGHERHGVPEKVGATQFTYVLTRITIDRLSGAGPSWSPVADTSDPAHPLAGTWQLVDSGNDNPPNQTLMLWSRSTSDWVREQSGPMYWAWTESHVAEAHCPDDSPTVERCVDWDGLPPGTGCHAGFELGGLVFDPSTTMTVVYRPVAAFGALNAVTGARTIVISGFPYGTTRVSVCVVVAPVGTTAAIDAYFEGVHVADDSVTATDPGTPPAVLVVESKAIDRVELSNVAAAYVYCVCYEAPLNPERQRAHDSWQTSADAWHSEDWVLDPYTTYRLKVFTQTTAKGGDAKSEEFVEHAYFKTGGPPGMPVVDANCPPAPIVENDPTWSDPGTKMAASERHQHYPRLGPLQDLRAYVQATIPVPDARPVYRAYDFRADFNETYVEHMYSLAKTKLGIYLYDANGEIVAEDRIDHTSGKSLSRVLTRSEAEWLYGYAKASTAGCFRPGAPPIDIDDFVTNLPLHDAVGALLKVPLKPEMLYEARLVAAKPDPGIVNPAEGQFVVYRWKFITSRYAHFRHHMGTFSDHVWEESISAEQLGKVKAIGAPPSDAGPAWRFEAIARAAGWMSPGDGPEPPRWLRPAPPRLDVSAVMCGNRCFGLLLESPEPLDGSRATIGALHPSLAPAFGRAELAGGRATPPGAAKVVAADLDATLAVVNDEFVDILILSATSLKEWKLEHRAGTHDGTEGFTKHYTFAGDERLPDGTLLRVHSGHAADKDLSPATSDPVYRHVFVEGDVRVLNASGERLRLVNAAGETIHSRTVLPSERYSPQLLNLAWNVDRTAAFLSLVSEDDPSIDLLPLPKGHYRLSCAYRLAPPDDPDLPELSMAGSGADETIHLDFALGTNELFLPFADRGAGLRGGQDTPEVGP